MLMPSSSVLRAVRSVLRNPVYTAVSTLSIATCTTVHAQGLQRTVNLNIQPQKVSTALIELSNQAAIQVLMPGLVGDEQSSPGVQGSMTLERALQELLRGTSLSFRITGDNVVGIETAAVSTRVNKQSNDYLPVAYTQAQPQPQSQETNDEPLQEVVVTSRIKFLENDAFGASKMGLPLIETPQTVSVVTADVIKFAQMRTFEDFYKVDASGGSSHAVDDFPRNYYRGFRQQGNNAIRVDGFRMPGNINLDLALFDRFEVIKGPTSSLYGQNSVGGTLNAVSKLPQNRTGVEFGLEIAEFDTYRADIDLTGAIANSDAWSYRFIGVYEDSKSYLDFAGDDTRVLSPSIQFKPSDATTFNLRLVYQESDLIQHFAPALQLAGNGTSTDPLERVLAEGLKVADVTRSRFYGMPWNNARTTAKFAQFQGEHVFANEWTLRTHAQANKVKYGSDALFVQGPFDQDGFAYLAYAYGQDEEASLYGAEVNLFGKVELFEREHTVFFGLDFNRLENERRLGNEVIFKGYADSIFNTFTPDYAAVEPFSVLDDYSYLYDTDNDDSLFGATVQLIAKPTDRLSALFSVRYSRDTLKTRERNGISPAEGGINQTPFALINDETFNEVVFQTGITYEVAESTNVYISYGETFEPSVDRVFISRSPSTGVVSATIPPEEGTSYEVGLKSNPNPDLSFSFALFELERSNISQPDRVNEGFNLPLGTQRSRGAEFGLQGKLLPELSLYLSMAYLDAEFIDGDFAGLSPENAPRFGISAFGSYEILEGPLVGLGFGLGVVHKQGRETFDEGWTRDSGQPVVFDFGDFTEVDARIFYAHGPWDYALSVSNLLDEKYYSPAFTELDFAVHVNPARTASFAVTYKFR
jgi:TonB-dependent siderophore receptor